MSGAVAEQSFDFGRVGNQITGLISRNFVPFVTASALLSGLPTLILAIFTMMMRPGPAAGMSGGTIVLSLLLSFVVILPGFVLQAALTRASIDDLNGKPVSIPNALQTGVANLFPLLGLAIVVGLGVGIGFMLLIIPGLILVTCWLVASPALVVEHLGIFAAMQRSLHLSRGHRWALFGIIVVFYIAIMIVAMIVGLIVTGSVGLQALAAAQSGGIVFGLINGIAQTFVIMVTTVGVAAVYFELRRIKEGVDVTELASVFD
ncbi:MAG: hypothetical protein GC190_02770 [Alphaproteobacteria bacterium]|nr:hypothetical protein [Alphaproteobacteria bacterium]